MSTEFASDMTAAASRREFSSQSQSLNITNDPPLPPALGIVRAVTASTVTVEVYLGVGGGVLNGEYIALTGTYTVGNQVLVIFRTQDPGSGVVLGVVGT